MACNIDYIVGDTGSEIHRTLKDKDGTVIDVSGGSAVIVFNIEGGAWVTTGAMVLVPPASGGTFKHKWLASELSIKGEMKGWVKYTDSLGFITHQLCPFIRAIGEKPG